MEEKLNVICTPQRESDYKMQSPTQTPSSATVVAEVPAGLEADPKVVFPCGYNMLSRLGQGGYATVYKVERASDGRAFAMKAIDLEKMDDHAKAAAVRERNIHSSLQHPNIVQYYDDYIDADRGMYFIRLECCSGGDLADLIDEQREKGSHFDEKVVWAFIRQLVQALRPCHEPSARSSDANTIILHRDIKPANILLSQDRTQLKLADFGLATEIKQGEWATSWCGTPDCMPPEMCTENRRDIRTTEAGDIWSLGCLLYELCTLNCLFDPPETPEQLSQLMQLIRKGVEHPIIPDTYSDELWDVLRWMLMTNPRDRPTIADLLQVPGIKYENPLNELAKCLEVNRILEAKQAESEAVQAQQEQEIQARDATLLECEAVITLQQDWALRTERQLQAVQLEHQEQISFYDGVVANLHSRIETETAHRERCQATLEQSQKQLAKLQKEHEELHQAVASRLTASPNPGIKTDTGAFKSSPSRVTKPVISGKKRSPLPSIKATSIVDAAKTIIPKAFSVRASRIPLPTKKTAVNGALTPTGSSDARSPLKQPLRTARTEARAGSSPEVTDGDTGGKCTAVLTSATVATKKPMPSIIPRPAASSIGAFNKIRAAAASNVLPFDKKPSSKVAVATAGVIKHRSYIPVATKTAASYTIALSTASTTPKRKLDQFQGVLHTAASATVEARFCPAPNAKRFRL